MTLGDFGVSGDLGNSHPYSSLLIPNHTTHPLSSLDIPSRP